MAELIDNLHGWLQELLGAGMLMPCIVFTGCGAGIYPPGGHAVAKYDAAFNESPQASGAYQPAGFRSQQAHASRRSLMPKMEH